MQILIVLLILSVAMPARAQDRPQRLIISDRALAVGLERQPPSAQSRDSLANGAIIGAIVGGVGMGIAGGWICHMLREPSDPPCWKSVLPVGALFAGIGAAAGAGIDALKAEDTRLLRARPEGSPQRFRR